MAKNELHTVLRVCVEDAAALDPHLELTYRPMFGGVMIYAAGKPFACFAEQGLSVKLAPSDREHLLREPGAVPMQHTGEGPSKTYVVVPPQIYDDAGQLRAWLDRSIDFVSATKAAPKRSRTSSRAPQE